MRATSMTRAEHSSALSVVPCTGPRLALHSRQPPTSWRAGCADTRKDPTMKTVRRSNAAALTAIVLLGCMAQIDGDEDPESLASSALTNIGDPLGGLTAEQLEAFEEGLDEFSE